MSKSNYHTFMTILILSYLVFFFAYFFLIDQVHPFVMLGASAIFAVSSLVLIGLSVIRLIRFWHWEKDGFLGIFFGILVVLFAVVFSLESFTYVKYQALFNNFKPACSGHAYPENPVFQENEFNALLGIDPPQKAGKWSANPIWQGWASENPKDVTLVACFHDYEILKETCKYTGATVKRYQNRVTVKLVEVKTGHILGEQEFLGTEPDDCLPAVSGSGEINGQEVGWNVVEDWLVGFVNPSIK
jgi:hypothetical protein